MGAAREKKLRKTTKEAPDLAAVERAYHQDTLMVLDALRQAARPAQGKIAWYESCIAEYRRLKELGLIKDSF